MINERMKELSGIAYIAEGKSAANDGKQITTYSEQLVNRAIDKALAAAEKKFVGRAVRIVENNVKVSGIVEKVTFNMKTDETLFWIDEVILHIKAEGEQGHYLYAPEYVEYI